MFSILQKAEPGGQEGNCIGMADKTKVIVMMLFAVLAVSLGETLLAKGMRQTSGFGGLAQVRAALTNGYVLGGTFFMTLYFGTYMAAVSMADFSFVLPLTALSYATGASLAKWYLHEHVSPTRWFGVFVITVGVAIVGFGERGGRP